MLLLAKIINHDVKYIIYDEETDVVSRISESEVIDNILNRKILNAKLENAVVKKTDGTLHTVADDELDEFLHVIDDVDGIYTCIDLLGQKYFMSFNVAKIFFLHKKLVNATITTTSIIVNKCKNFITPLHRSICHQRD